MVGLVGMLVVGGWLTPASGAEGERPEQGEDVECEAGEEHREGQAPQCEGEEEPAGGNECPSQDLDPSDNLFSLQTPVAGVCWDLRDLSFGHVWVDGNEDNPGPASGYVSVANDGPDHHSDHEDEPDDGRSADPPWGCVNAEGGPDSGGDEPVVCADGGHPLGDNIGMHPAPEVNQCRAWLTGEENDGTERHEAHLCVEEDGSPGPPNPENIPTPPALQD